jgi:glycosyltransferase involved in cell wall biosynthesis
MIEVPYRIRTRIQGTRNRWSFHRNTLRHSVLRAGVSTQPPHVVVHCGFQGQSGGTYAMASIANLLAQRYRVDFISRPPSIYNSLLSSSVRIVSRLESGPGVYVCDVSTPPEAVDDARAAGKTILVSCHGLPSALHGMEPSRVRAALDRADLVHFVAVAQAEAFDMGPDRCRVIPNATAPILKRRSGNDVGIVGNLREERKNARQALAIALRSGAGTVHLWGADSNAHNGRVRSHVWSQSKRRIYESFDVLVSLSRLECCPMVVLEALSAGIPCLLSSIPAHEQFRECRGVRIVGLGDDDRAVTLLNELLVAKQQLRTATVAFWADHFSAQSVGAQWVRWMTEIQGGSCAPPGPPLQHPDGPQCVRVIDTVGPVFDE